MDLDRLAKLINDYGYTIGRRGSSRRIGTLTGGQPCMSTMDECEFIIRGLLFRYHRFYYGGDIYINKIIIDTKKGIPRVCIYSSYDNIPLEGSWIKVIEDIFEILEQVEVDAIFARRAKDKKDQEDRQQRTKQTIKEWNEKYGDKL